MASVLPGEPGGLPRKPRPPVEDPAAPVTREGRAANAIRVLAAKGNTNGNSWLKDAVAAEMAKNGTAPAPTGEDKVASALGMKEKKARKRPAKAADSAARAANAVKVLASLPSQAQAPGRIPTFLKAPAPVALGEDPNKA